MYGLLKPSTGKKAGLGSMGDCTAIELIGPDRPGLLSEISAVLANLQINVAAAEVWTHNGRIACVLYVNDDTNNRAVDDASWLAAMEEQVKNILRGYGTDDSISFTSYSMGSTHIDRRLHQLFFADRDYEVTGTEPDSHIKPNVTIERCEEKDYSVVTVKCKDRPKLMFDIVCTLTDMQYVVFHATISSDGPYASQVSTHSRLFQCSYACFDSVYPLHSVASTNIGKLQLIGIFHTPNGRLHTADRRRERKGHQVSRSSNQTKTK